jgi:hypothetical protein
VAPLSCDPRRAVYSQSSVWRQSETHDCPTDAKIDDEFLSCMRERKQLLESFLDGDALIADDRESDRLASRALPRVEDMDKTLRYESRMQQQLEWALQRLLECQQRRNESGRLRGPSLMPAIK